MQKTNEEEKQSDNVQRMRQKAAELKAKRASATLDAFNTREVQAEYERLFLSDDLSWKELVEVARSEGHLSQVEADSKDAVSTLTRRIRTARQRLGLSEHFKGRRKRRKTSETSETKDIGESIRPVATRTQISKVSVLKTRTLAASSAGSLPRASKSHQGDIDLEFQTTAS